jgi:hypothetical protein
MGKIGDPLHTFSEYPNYTMWAEQLPGKLICNIPSFPASFLLGLNIFLMI